MKALAIRDFRTVFLPPGYGKKIGPLKFIGIPTKQDSCGYRRLVAEPNGAALYGAWVATAAVAAKCPIKGVLATDSPMDAATLAVRTGLAESVLVELIERVGRDDIGWIEQVDWPVVTADNVWPPKSLADDVKPLRFQENPSDHRESPENAGDCRKTPTTDSTDRTIPTRPDQQDNTRPNRQDSEASDRNLQVDLNGSGRNGNGELVKFRNLFAFKVGTALGNGCGGMTVQRRPLLAAARRFEHRADRDECLLRCEQIAREKSGASLDNPAAAWQKTVNELYPPAVHAIQERGIDRMVG